MHTYNMILYNIVNIRGLFYYQHSTNCAIIKYSKRDISNSLDIFSSKETYVKHKWDSDFPTHSSLSYDDIASLSSRSRDIGTWYKKISDEYVLYKEAPEWFLDSNKDASEWTKEIQDKYVLVKIANKEYTDDINKISLKAKTDMARKQVEHKEKLIDLLSDTPELVLELINSQMLPIETHLKAFEFKSKEEAKNFITNEVKIFKTNTYEKYLNGDLSSQQLVEILFEK